MKRFVWTWLLSVLGATLSARGQTEDPFLPSASLVATGVAAEVVVVWPVPAGHHVYADTVAVAADGQELTVWRGAPAHPETDRFTGELRDVYTSGFTRAYALTGPAPTGVTALVRYQGCDERMCFFPQRRTLALGAAAAPVPPAAVAPPPAAADDAWVAAANRFRVVERAVGYVSASDFLAWLDRAEGVRAPAAHRRGGWTALRERAVLFDRDPVEFFRLHGLGLTLLLILLGGLALNLTPCVLPMIPINLAVIGAGARASSRRRGFALGAVYGGAIAAVYGLLGLFVVLTGSRFGALNASPWFNAAIGVLFVALGLAMFDVFAIDLSRWQGRLGAGGDARRGTLFTALSMGALSALLAGACVAPVVISVLVLAQNLFSRGVAAGLLLPFLLGAGMALPWPLAGAGLSFLPKPGAWMKGVKIVFGVFILLLALYYLRVAYRGFRPARAPAVAAEADLRGDLARALSAAAEEGQPVFLDFWATWCKSCEAMEVTTFRDPAVLARLARYRVVKVQAEQPNDPPAQPVLERFGALGLPTYVVLEPLPAPAGGTP